MSSVPGSAAGPTPGSINGWNAEFLESEYQRWRADAASVAPDMARFFQGFDLALSGHGGGAGAGAPRGEVGAGGGDLAGVGVRDLIEAYRAHGHLAAAIDPFGRAREGHPSLEWTRHGLSERDLERRFPAGALAADGQPMELRRIIAALQQTYCGSIGLEFDYVSNDEERAWLTGRMEASRGKAELSDALRRRILTHLYKAELWERFCAKKYVGMKRFSLEGGDSLIPLLDKVLECLGEQNVEEVVMGMAHRGRLNVLTNIVGKTYDQIFTEFEDAWEEDWAGGGGDVKYHRGYSSNRVLTSGRHVWVTMASNPSHLESVNPVVLGRTRAKQRMIGDYERRKVVPVLIHGDAAFIGQGVVAETLNLSQLEGYHVGGTVHVVTNNLIGFTTGEEDARSCRYCTDIAKMIEAPVLHVNGEDPEACVLAAEIAAEYRMLFRKDVVIDMVCYRRHGHNETDEAAFTQPLLYKQIKDMPTVLRTYAQKLLETGVIAQEDRDALEQGLTDSLETSLKNAKATPVDPTPEPGHELWQGITSKFSFAAVETGVERGTLDKVAKALGRWPEGFTPHPKLVTTLQGRAQSVEKDLPIDWGTAENLAVGTLIHEGHVVRLTGQDCRRGTFSHRHAALRDINTGALFVPLSHMSEELGPQVVKPLNVRNTHTRSLEGRYWVYDSALSEFAVLGFEYGFSLASPGPLVMWEAQFGDFVNGAQVIIDQYIAAGEAKWQRWSGLVMLLPHGYEGQGPEHSSARLERFLQLCADNNFQVCHPTTPAQHFHMLRRQVSPERRFRKPLVVMTPKSLLRLPAAASRVEELVKGSFQEVLDDPKFIAGGSAARKKVQRVLLCSGKVYYDLINRRQQAGREDLAIVRVEQLYPLHTDRLREVIDSYPKGSEVVWCQEEPRNMGAYTFVAGQLAETLGWELPYTGRPAAATPATGSHHKHDEQLEEFLNDAVGPLAPSSPGAADAAHAAAH